MKDAVKQRRAKVDAFLAKAPNIDRDDPVAFAAEAAFEALERGWLDPEVIAQRAVHHMPGASTKFERGVAFGLALALAMNPAP